MGENVISVRDFRKAYGQTVAVDGISFDVGRGEIFGLLGPNGAGKTSTLECLEGIRRADGGRLDILGVDPGRDARRLPQSDRRAAADFGRCRQHHRERGDALLLRLPSGRPALRPAGPVGPGREARHASSASSRPGSSAAWRWPWPIAHRPAVVILDEPTAGLDVGSRSELHAMMDELKREGTSDPAGHARHGRGRKDGRPGGDPAARQDRGRGHAA